MSEKLDAMFGEDAADYIRQLQGEIKRLQAEIKSWKALVNAYERDARRALEEKT